MTGSISLTSHLTTMHAKLVTPWTGLMKAGQQKLDLTRRPSAGAESHSVGAASQGVCAPGAAAARASAAAGAAALGGDALAAVACAAGGLSLRPSAIPAADGECGSPALGCLLLSADADEGPEEASADALGSSALAESGRAGDWALRHAVAEAGVRDGTPPALGLGGLCLLDSPGLPS